MQAGLSEDVMVAVTLASGCVLSETLFLSGKLLLPSEAISPAETLPQTKEAAFIMTLAPGFGTLQTYIWRGRRSSNLQQC